MIPSSTRPFDAGALAAADGWGAGLAALAVLDDEGLVAIHGARDVAVRWASITKLLTACVTLIAAERGILDLDEPAGPRGSTVRHLLAHAAGYAFDDRTVISPPGWSRIYSNAGYDELAEVVSDRAGRPFADLLQSWLLAPLGMTGARLTGRPSAGLTGTLDDLVAFAFELLRPRVVPTARLAEATSVAFPGLRGMLPGVAAFDPLDWGLGFEIRDGKVPHWTGTRNSPRTFGHFGGSGTFLWVDPEARLALACLTDREYGPWALRAWPAMSDAVLQAAG